MLKHTLILLVLSFILISCNQPTEKPQNTDDKDSLGRFITVQGLGGQIPNEEAVRVLIRWGYNDKVYNYNCLWGSKFDFSIESDQKLDIVQESNPGAPMDGNDSAVMDGDNKIVVSASIGYHRDGFVFDMKRGATLKINGTVKLGYTQAEETLENGNLGAFASPEMVSMMESMTVGHPGFTGGYHNRCYYLQSVFGIPEAQ